MKLVKTRGVGLWLGATLLFLFACGQGVEAPQAQQWQLVWADEFDYTGQPDTTRWAYDLGDGCPHLCGWGNNELQHYTNRPENVRIEDGLLVIEAHREPFENREYTSTRLVTRGKASWLYGRIEARARLPKGRGTWPAIWMLPDDMSDGWPLCGEIDIMEHVGYLPDSIFGTIHTRAFNHLEGTQRGDRAYVPDCEEAFHVYALEWDADSLRWFVDEQQFFAFANEGSGKEAWPFDKPFHLLVNLAVGGNWGGKMGVDTTIWPQRFLVDYVRVYQKESARQ